MELNQVSVMPYSPRGNLDGSIQAVDPETENNVTGEGAPETEEELKKRLEVEA